MKIKETLLKELETLSEQKQEDVLTFVRFLKIGMADSQSLKEQYITSLSRARKLAEERGITEQDIADEIEAVRDQRLCE